MTYLRETVDAKGKQRSSDAYELLLKPLKHCHFNILSKSLTLSQFDSINKTLHQ